MTLGIRYRLTTSLLLTTLICLVIAAAVPAMADQSNASPHRSGPWDLDHLYTVPEFTWGAKTGLVREVYYENEPYRGKPTRVYAYYARPAQGDGPFPTMLLLHGGGGQAFADWATFWAERGYAALAMDLAGCGPKRVRLPDGGPGQSRPDKFGHFTDATVGEMWSYHAVAAAIRGHSLLASFDEVDADRIGITGVSWGGILTCIIAGVDHRLKVAVPVYGCGFLHENSSWNSLFRAMEPSLRDRWARNFDPSGYMPKVRCPMLMITGTNDRNYPLDSHRKSYRAVGAPKQLLLIVRMPHNHKEGWKPKEIGLFVDSVLRGGTPLPKVGPMQCNDGQARAEVTSETPVVGAQLHYTSDQGPRIDRHWVSIEAQVVDGEAVVSLPTAKPLVCYFTIRDDRDARISTEYVVLKGTDQS